MKLQTIVPNYCSNAQLIYIRSYGLVCSLASFNVCPGGNFRLKGLENFLNHPLILNDGVFHEHTHLYQS